MPTHTPRQVPGTCLHVRCGPTGTWFVQVDGSQTRLSEHASETEAERAACERAAQHGGYKVVVHDRYARTHGPALPQPPRGLWPKT